MSIAFKAPTIAGTGIPFDIPTLIRNKRELEFELAVIKSGLDRWKFKPPIFPGEQFEFHILSARAAEAKIRLYRIEREIAAAKAERRARYVDGPQEIETN